MTYWLCLSVFGVLWRPYSRGSCQVGYLAHTNWEPLTWNIRTPVSIICKQIFVEMSLVEQLYLLFFLFWLARFVFYMFESFPYCSTSESGSLNFHLLQFLWYLEFVCQLLGSFGGHILMDPVKWAKLWPPAERLYFKISAQLFPSSANIVCGKKPCRQPQITCFLFFD